MKQLINEQELIGKTIKSFPLGIENEDLIIFFEDNTYAILSSDCSMESKEHANFQLDQFTTNSQKRDLEFITDEEYTKLRLEEHRQDAIETLEYLKAQYPELFITESSVSTLSTKELDNKQYHIFHATGPDRFREVENQPREYAGFVYANSLEEAYRLSQNIEDDWNSTNPCRSTSIGDVIQKDGKFFMVCGTGFKELIQPKEDLASIADSEDEMRNQG